MALAVVFAMLASYILSRTLVPVLAAYLLRAEQHQVNPETGIPEQAQTSESWFSRFNAKFNAGYIYVRTRYTGWLRAFLGRPRVSLLATAAIIASAFLLLPFIGRDFFPEVDAGQFRFHVRAASF